MSPYLSVSLPICPSRLVSTIARILVRTSDYLCVHCPRQGTLFSGCRHEGDAATLFTHSRIWVSAIATMRAAGMIEATTTSSRRRPRTSAHKCTQETTHPFFRERGPVPSDRRLLIGPRARSLFFPTPSPLCGRAHVRGPLCAILEPDARAALLTHIRRPHFTTGKISWPSSRLDKRAPCVTTIKTF